MYLSPSKFEISLHFENFENPRIFFCENPRIIFFYDVHKENMLYFCRDSVKIQAFNIKQTKLSKNPSKNIMFRIITQGSCINRYILLYFLLLNYTFANFKLIVNMFSLCTS